MIIYMDESGDLGLDFTHQKTSRYLVIGLLVFPDGSANIAHIRMIQAVKRTIKNKVPKSTVELKGNRLSFSMKKYFLKEANKQLNWCLYVAIADKKSWVKHHAKHNHNLDKKVLYDEIARRIFSQVEGFETVSNIDIIVDCSKNKNEKIVFDHAITTALSNRIAKNTLLSIQHCTSHDYAGLQAVDVFCSGVRWKYEHNDLEWYKEFSEKIAVEEEYKF